MDVRRILCPIDFSAPSAHALEHAAGLARWFGARLAVLHVRPTVTPHPDMPPGGPVAPWLVTELEGLQQRVAAAAAEATATYFIDMQRVARRCHEFLRPGGISVFVVGNTQLSGVRIDNANHLVESLLDSGFIDVRVVKRQLSNKPNTPYRLPNGRLSSTRTEMQIYAEEYIVMAQRG